MILLPAVDILDGRAVRLERGDFASKHVYADEPLAAARAWAAAGARYLHVVDLDGARDGQPRNLDHLRRIAREVELPVQYGGGLRTLEAVRDALDAGAEQVVIGTAAYRDEAFLDAALGSWEQRVVVAVDVRGGRVSVAGWSEATQMTAAELIVTLQRRGVERFVYTNVDRDGLLEGVDIDEVKRIADVVRGRFLYSGGVGSLDDLRSLAGLRLDNLSGVISGKALYEGRFTIADAHAALAEATAEADALLDDALARAAALAGDTVADPEALGGETLADPEALGGETLANPEAPVDRAD